MRPTDPHTSTPLTRRRVLHATLGGLTGFAAWQGWPRLQVAMAQKGAPAGQMTWALHFTLTPQWFDPAETGGLLTLTIGPYALHDALVKPMPDGQMAPCLATAWHESEDGLTYDFALRHGVTFQNKDIHQHPTAPMIDGMLQPALVLLLAHKGPHCVDFCVIHTADDDLDNVRVECSEAGGVDGCESRPFFFNSLSTVLVLICNTRAVSRTPLALRLISMTCCLTSGKRPLYAGLSRKD